MNHWLRHRRVLEALLKTIPDEQIGYKPWTVRWRSGSWHRHIAASTDMLFPSPRRGSEIKPPEIADCRTMEEVRRVVTEYTEKTKGDIRVTYR